MAAHVQPGLPFVDLVAENRVLRWQMVFPYVPPSKNRFDGWPATWKAGLKRRWVDAICREVTIQQIPAAEQVGVAIEVQFKSKAHRDPQNYAQCLWNWVPDGLVKAGVIPDDGEGRVLIGPNWGVRLAVGDRQLTRVVVTQRVESWRLV